MSAPTKFKSAEIFGDECQVLRFRGTNTKPSLFKWIDRSTTGMEYSSVVTSLLQEYDRVDFTLQASGFRPPNGSRFDFQPSVVRIFSPIGSVAVVQFCLRPLDNKVIERSVTSAYTHAKTFKGVS